MLSVELIVPSEAIATFVPAVNAATTFVVSVTSALASIPSNLLWSLSVNAFVSEFDSYNVFISDAVWSAVALLSMLSNLVFSVFVKSLAVGVKVISEALCLFNVSVWPLTLALVTFPVANVNCEGNVITPVELS